jgi:phosphoribosylformylglycinamidine synthase
MDDYGRMATIAFKAAGEAIYLMGQEPWATPTLARGHLGQSLWLREIHGREDGDAPPVDLTLEKNSGEFVRELIAAGLVSAVHDVSDGGLAIALAEMALAGGVGAEVEPHPDYTPAAWWFGEDQGRYLMTVPDVAAFQAQLAKGTRDADTASSGMRRIGTVGGDGLLGVPLTAMHDASASFFRNWMEG